MPRLLHVTTVPMTLNFLRGQVGYAQQRGYWVGAASAPASELEEFSRAHGVPAFAVPMERRITPLRDIRSVFGLVRTLRSERPDIVHSHTPKGGLLGMIAGRLAGVPVRIYHMHGLPLETARGHRRLLLRWSERVSCALADRVLCVSNTLRDVAIREQLVHPDKIQVVAGGSINGVDALDRFNPARAGNSGIETRARLGIPEEATVLGFVGRLVRDKGIVELAHAWRSLRASYPLAHLLLVGPFETEDPVPEQLLADLQADPRVHFTGKDWNTPPLFAAMDVLTLPSYREGFPNVPLEAAAMELPVVTTNVAGCIESVVDGVTGKVVPVRDVPALVAALEAYLGSPELRKKHGKAGRNRMLTSFQQEVIWDATLQIYEQLLFSRGTNSDESQPKQHSAARD